MVLRMLLIQSTKSAVMSAHKRAHKRGDPISQWVVKLKEKSGWQKAAVALANENTRILWAVVTKGVAFGARHVSVKPGAAIEYMGGNHGNGMGPRRAVGILVRAAKKRCNKAVCRCAVCSRFRHCR